MPQPADTPADTHDTISIRGARVNNLRDIDVDIPKRRLTVFTGLSGSGKSSLVFGTIAAESQRLINETYSAFLQTFMAPIGRPDVDVMENLTPAIVVDQEPMTPNSRSTVGTATDVNALLRILFSRLSDPYVGPGFHFSFNTPQGMCGSCEGTGKASAIDEDALIDKDLSLNEGAITVPGFAVDNWYWRVYADSGKFDTDKKLRDYTPAEWQAFMYDSGGKVETHGINMTYEGLVPKVRRLFLDKAKPSTQKSVVAFVERIATFTACPDCGGSRLNEPARTASVAGRTLPECCAMQITDLADWVAGLDAPAAAPLIANVRLALDSLVTIGLGYLSLDREAGTLSGGEAQRAKMVRHLGSPLTDITYVFDEPTVGLHPHDIARMNELLLQLRDKGNTVLVVEHKPEVIAIADHVVDLGPGAGSDGGTITFSGSVADLRASGTLTGRLLDTRPGLRRESRPATGQIEIRNAATHNLRDVSVDVPLGQLVVVTGVAGSGKSSLIHACMPASAGVRIMDQRPIRGSIRSNPATYSGLLDPIRTAFAKANKVKPAMFSANSSGACPVCKGLGVTYTDLAMMAGVASRCEECEGRRFTDEVLGYTLRGKNIHEVLEMPIAQAHGFFTTGAPRLILQRLVDVGLGYIRLGQPLNTLSGGERQRLKLAIAMAEGAGTYVLDEPTSGLHLADIDHLLAMLDHLVEQGNSLIVIEHHRAVMAHADWIIDLGPGAGHDGGRVVFEGTPAQMVAQCDTITARHLSEWVGARG